MGKEKHKKDKTKVKKDKKDKKHKKHRRRSSSDSSDSDDSVEGVEQQLQRERAAVNKLRDILCAYPSVRRELREMLWRVDQGEAANISGVPDPELKAQLAKFLELMRLRRNDKGIYGLINRNERTLPVVGFVFDEPPRPRPAAVAPPPAPAAQAPPQPAPHQRPASPERKVGAATAQGTLTGAAATAPKQEADFPGVGAAAKGEPGTQHRRIGPIGTTMPEPPECDSAAARDQQRDNDDDEGQGRNGEAAVKKEGGAGSEGPGPEVTPGPGLSRRVAGPAMPPKELLEAAAAAAEALRAAGPPGTAGLSYGDSDNDDDGFLVGPPPPELVMELDAAPQNEREAEVVRIAKVLRESSDAKKGPGSGLAAQAAGSSGADAVDAYAVLDIAPSTTAAEVKKRYMRLSLLIHPDKCAHPLAHEAFQAVATAARVLQDSGLRSALDERRADTELRRRAEAAAAQQDRERAWRIARGEEVPTTGPVGPSGPHRETWMTELPPEMSTRVGAGVSQASVRAFSQRGKIGRGDTSGWTDNPEQRKAREAQALLAAASEAYVRALPAAADASGEAAAGGVANGSRGVAAAAALDSFNSVSRKKSLMEVHLEMQEKAQKEAKAARKSAKKQKTADTTLEDGSGSQDWPWRPFDRERDLDIKPKAKSGPDILKSATALGSKFSGGGTQRHFL